MTFHERAQLGYDKCYISFEELQETLAKPDYSDVPLNMGFCGHKPNDYDDSAFGYVPPMKKKPVMDKRTKDLVKNLLGLDDEEKVPVPSEDQFLG